MIRISVIIPVYNAAPYLGECVESLLSQTESSMEFIFVNDGSTDRSADILSAFLDPRIRVIDQPNAGVSAARNAGLAVARGKYIGFVDADDYVEKEMFETLADAADTHQVEIVFSAFKVHQDGKVWEQRFPFPSAVLLDRNAIDREVKPFLVRRDTLNTVCTKLYSRHLLSHRGIAFKKGVALGEDALFNMLAINVAEQCVYVDYRGYHYRDVPGSATRSPETKDYFAEVIAVYNFPYREYLDLDLSESEFEELRSLRLIESVFSLVHVYLYAKHITLGERFRRVKLMITHPIVVKAVQDFGHALTQTKSKYYALIILGIKKKMPVVLYLVTLYSKIRNRI